MEQTQIKEEDASVYVLPKDIDRLCPSIGEEAYVEVCYQDQIEDEEEVLANMRLIKCAPELFELLVEMMHEGCIEATYADRVREMVGKVLQEEERK